VVGVALLLCCSKYSPMDVVFNALIVSFRTAEPEGNTTSVAPLCLEKPPS